MNEQEGLDTKILKTKGQRMNSYNEEEIKEEPKRVNNRSLSWKLDRIIELMEYHLELTWCREEDEKKKDRSSIDLPF